MTEIQNDFSGGQISRRFIGKHNYRKYNKSLAVCKNCLPTTKKTVVRRQGTQFVDHATQAGSILYSYDNRMFEFSNVWVNPYSRSHTDTVNGYLTKETIISGKGRFTSYGTAHLSDIRFASDGNNLLIANRHQLPHIMSVTSGGTISIKQLTTDGNDVIKIGNANKDDGLPANVAFHNGRLILSNFSNNKALIAGTRLYQEPKSASEQIEITAVEGVLSALNAALDSTTAVSLAQLAENINDVVSTDTADPNSADTWGSDSLEFRLRNAVRHVAGLKYNSLSEMRTAVLAVTTAYDSVQVDTDYVPPTEGRYSFRQSNPLLASDPYRIELTGAEEIKHIISADQLIAFTDVDVRSIKGASGTLESIDISTIYNQASNNVVPILAGKDIVFVTESGQEIIALLYDSLGETYQAESLTQDIDLFDDKKIKQMVWDADDYILWVLTDDGKLFSLTYYKSLTNPNDDVKGWATHEIWDGNNIIQSISLDKTVNKDNSDNLLKMVLSIGEQNYILKISKQPLDIPIYSDLAVIKYAENGATTIDYTADISGQDTGYDVVVALDGAGIGTYQTTTADNTLTFEYSFKSAVVGKPYEYYIETMPYERGRESYGKNKHLKRVVTHTIDSDYYNIGVKGLQAVKTRRKVVDGVMAEFSLINEVREHVLFSKPMLDCRLVISGNGVNNFELQLVSAKVSFGGR